MNQFYSKYARPVIFSMMVIICVSFLVQLVALGGGYYEDVNAQAIEHAGDYALEQSLYVRAQFDTLKTRTELYAAALGSWAQENDAKSLLHTIRTELFELDRDNFRELLYVHDGRLFGLDGREVTGYAELDALAGAADTTGTVVTRAFQYDNTLMSVAVSAPVTGSFVERLVLIYARSTVSLDSFAYTAQGALIDSVAASEFVLLCKHDGVIVERIVNSDSIDPGNEPVSVGLFRRLLATARPSGASRR